VEERGENTLGAKGSLRGGLEEHRVTREERRNQRIDLNEVYTIPSVPSQFIPFICTHKGTRQGSNQQDVN
jgi:hypothetical protein